MNNRLRALYAYFEPTSVPRTHPSWARVRRRQEWGDLFLALPLVLVPSAVVLAAFGLEALWRGWF